jgi:hypothetical protein
MTALLGSGAYALRLRTGSRMTGAGGVSSAPSVTGWLGTNRVTGAKSWPKWIRETALARDRLPRQRHYPAAVGAASSDITKARGGDACAMAAPG